MSENLKRTSNQSQNLNPNDLSDTFDMPKKKKNRLGIKKDEDELSPDFICNANETIFFKIIHKVVLH